jgi:hypothetical protein
MIHFQDDPVPQLPGGISRGRSDRRELVPADAGQATHDQQRTPQLRHAGMPDDQ